MDIQELRYAVTLAEELHFGRAARRHFISAQPFGRRIQRLERELGVALFERTSRRVTVTAAGERVLAHARSVLATLDALPELGRREDARDTTLTIGVLGFGLADCWPRFVGLLRDRLPFCTFVYSDVDFVDQYEALHAQRVDVGLVHYAGPVDGLVFDRVLTVPRVAVVPARSPFADAERLSPADLRDEIWVPVASSHPGLASWAGPAVNGARGTAPVRTPAALPEAVSATGWLSLHAAAAARFYPHHGVRFVPLDGPPCEIAVATRESDHRPAVEAARQAARVLPGVPGMAT
ncbi:LysR family transcriptional regulator [Streptomyces sp. NPDC048636]|uniref:LysR family transcriptional regulator n=1 Tax=Streptomyces sp. NPDC048636 TaxID=3155762 RepID=UPI003421002E